MEIIGYSERGAMNALFYGMSYDKTNGNEAMNAFLKLAGFHSENFKEFELYMEFSLSEFGDPDLVIIAEDNKNEKTLFFVEAKASCHHKFDLKRQEDKHKEYVIEGRKHSDGDSSNLFFQLRLKNYFIDVITSQNENNNRPECILNSRKKRRQYGKNTIVIKFVDKLKEVKNIEYIAIIPKQLNEININNDYGFDIHFVTWEDIYNQDKFKVYLKETIEFNGGNTHQIFNKIKRGR